MLEGLERVAWEELEHAYGTAEDVPMWILALASPDENKRAAALGEFWSSVIHQGTVYSVTSYVVPFLVELLTAPETPDKASILRLLTAFSEGASYHDAHYEMDKVSGIYGDEIDSPEWHAKIQEELGWVGAAHLAVVHGAPTYLRVLETESDTKLRIAATCTLATCFERAEEILPVLLQRAANEPETIVQASCLFAAAELADRTNNPAVLHLAQKLLLDGTTPPLLQAVAALVAVRAMGNNAPDSVILPLVEYLKNPAPVDAAFRMLPWAEGEGFAAAAGIALLPLGERTAPLLISILLQDIAVRDAVEREDDGWGGVLSADLEVRTLTEVILIACNFEVRNENPYAEERISIAPSEMTPRQRETLSRLAHFKQPWFSGDVSLRLRQYGLPDGRDGMREFLAA